MTRRALLTLAVLCLGIAVVALAVWAWPHSQVPAAADQSHAGKRQTSPSHPDSSAPAAEEALNPFAAADGLLTIVAADSHGAPVAGALVRVSWRASHSGSTGWRLIASQFTVANGRLELPAGEGEFLVEGRHPGHARAWVSTVRSKLESRSTVTLRFATASTLSGGLVDAATHQAVTPGTIHLAPLLALSAFKPPDGLAAPLEEDVSADAMGHFSFEDLSPGTYRLTVEAPGYGPLQREAVVPSSGLVLSLVRDAALRGFVETSSGGPAAGATVTASGASPPRETRKRAPCRRPSP